MVALLLLSCLAACSPGFDQPYQVKDLRVLAIRADPPEFVFKTQQDGQAAVAAGLDVNVNVLIADPAGGGRTLDCKIRTCGLPSSARCDDAKAVWILKEASCTAGENPMTVKLGPDHVAAALEADIAHGYSGIPVWLELTVTGGEYELYALKDVVIATEFPAGRIPNTNPMMIGLNLDGGPVDAGGTIRFSAGQEIKVQVARTRASKEAYVLPSMKNPGEAVELLEYMSVAFYSDAGDFSKSNVSDKVHNPLLADPEQNKPVDMSVKWHAPGDSSVQEVDFWFVLTDGRGGTDWLMVKGVME
jgi:hypothetical protein